MPHIVALLPNAQDAALLSRGLGTLVRVCLTHGELRASMNTSIDCVLLDLTCDVDIAVIDSIALVRNAYPSTILVALGSTHPRVIRLLPAVIRAGVTHVLIRGEDDLVAGVRFALSSGRDVPRMILSRTLPESPAAAHPLFRYLAENADRPLQVQGVADALGWHRRTLHDRTSRNNLPEPRTLLIWHRLLHASARLEGTVTSLDALAGTLDFPSASSLHNQLRKYAACRSSELRTAGAFDRLLNQFVGELAQHRTAFLLTRKVACSRDVGA